MVDQPLVEVKFPALLMFHIRSEQIIKYNEMFLHTMHPELKLSVFKNSFKSVWRHAHQLLTIA